MLEAVQPVRWTPFETWRRRGAGGRIAIRRLRGGLDAARVAALREHGERWLGRDYDLLFQWSDERLYCSELVHELFDRALGISLVQPQRWRDPSLGPSARALARRRLGRMPLPDGLLVTPAALLRSAHLVEVSPGR